MFKLDFWLIFGLVGQAAFFMRFVVQWIYSERKGESLIPIHFWTFSVAGALIILVYSIHRHDPVFIIGQFFALLIYGRNIALIRKRKNRVDQN